MLTDFDYLNESAQTALLETDEELETSRQDNEQNKTLRRQQRLRDCGKYAWWFDPHTGGRAGYIRHCDNFRECNVCLQRRAKQEYEWMKLTVYKDEIKMVVTTAKDKKAATAMTRGIDKDQYVRYPQEDGTEILFFDKAACDQGEDVTPNWMRKNSGNWEDWALTPKGRNKSGTMHIPEPTTEDEPFSIVTIKQFVTEAPEHIVTKVMDTAIEETDYMDPKTAEEVEEFSELRFMKATAELVKLGFNLRVYEKKMKVIHSKIDWSNSLLTDLMVNTENPTQIPKFDPEY